MSTATTNQKQVFLSAATPAELSDLVELKKEQYGESIKKINHSIIHPRIGFTLYTATVYYQAA